MRSAPRQENSLSSASPFIELRGSKRSRLLTSPPAAAKALRPGERKAVPAGAAGAGTPLPPQPAAGIYLAVSFHPASSPSFTQISSSSVNKSRGTCCSSSSVPRMNCTRWDGVSGGRRQSPVPLPRLNMARHAHMQSGHRIGTSSATNIGLAPLPWATWTCLQKTPVPT